ncbi:MAG: hypothetical protein PHD01_13485 [Geobacteraceae bacterium]|nr:hypothetical protein [Geobacteraceae bacterium]
MVNKSCLSIDLESLSKNIPESHLFRFVILSEIFSPADLLKIYDARSIRLCRRKLRDAGFDYPVRPNVSGPGRGKRKAPARDAELMEVV